MGISNIQEKWKAAINTDILLKGKFPRLQALTLGSGGGMVTREESEKYGKRLSCAAEVGEWEK